MLLTQHSIHSIPRLDSDDYDWFFIFCVFHSGEGNAEIILDRFPALLKKETVENPTLKNKTESRTQFFWSSSLLSHR